MTDENTTVTPEERYEAGAAKARARYENAPSGPIPITSKLSPITPPNTQETK